MLLFFWIGCSNPLEECRAACNKDREEPYQECMKSVPQSIKAIEEKLEKDDFMEPSSLQKKMMPDILSREEQILYAKETLQKLKKGDVCKDEASTKIKWKECNRTCFYAHAK
tara:strand:- start:290 stop:625 length:336 start_codon:yes stop_codon:yes gene_type:complete